MIVHKTGCASAPTEGHSPRGHRNRFARWRAGSLLLVYILMAVHIAHWKISGKTLAP